MHTQTFLFPEASQLMKKNLLINVNKAGNLGNHFLNYLWMLEISCQAGVGVVNPALKKYSAWFSNLPNNTVVVCAPRSEYRLNWFQYILYYIFLNQSSLSLLNHIRIVYRVRILSHLSFLFGYIAFDWLLVDSHSSKWLQPTFVCSDGKPDFFGPGLRNMFTKYRLTLLDSAAIISDFTLLDTRTIALAKYYFKPSPSYVKAPIKLQNKCRIENTILIGVSIRQGDFKSWQGGIYYVEAESFAYVLSSLVSSLQQSHLLVLCSDENLDKSIFSQFNTFYPEYLPPVQLAYLMYCDYILGTQHSSFIQMASFLGNVPLFCLTQANKMNTVSFSSFEVALT